MTPSYMPPGIQRNVLVVFAFAQTLLLRYECRKLDFHFMLTTIQTKMSSSNFVLHNVGVFLVMSSLDKNLCLPTTKLENLH